MVDPSGHDGLMDIMMAESIGSMIDSMELSVNTAVYHAALGVENGETDNQIITSFAVQQVMGIVLGAAASELSGVIESLQDGTFMASEEADQLAEYGTSQADEELWQEDADVEEAGEAMAGASAEVTPLRADAPLTELEIKAINPSGSETNCNECAYALDQYLGGKPLVQAEDSMPHSPYDLEDLYPGKEFSQPYKSQQDIIDQMQAAGPGARGIVYGARSPGSVPEYGHVFNVVNDKGTVIFLDGQKGGEAVLNYKSLQLLRTN